MNKAHALLFALMMMTVSLAGRFGGGDDGGDSNDDTPSEPLGDWQVHFAAASHIFPNATNHWPIQAIEGFMWNCFIPRF